MFTSQNGSKTRLLTGYGVKSDIDQAIRYRLSTLPLIFYSLSHRKDSEEDIVIKRQMLH